MLSRQNVAKTIALSAVYAGKKLKILVENQGRINQNVMNDFKGLFNVKLDDNLITNWTITGFPLSDARPIESLIRESHGSTSYMLHIAKFESNILYNGPVIYHATFNIEQNEIYDTYINPIGWGKVMNAAMTH